MAEDNDDNKSKNIKKKKILNKFTKKRKTTNEET